MVRRGIAYLYLIIFRNSACLKKAALKKYFFYQLLIGSTPYTGLHPSEVMKKVRDGYRLEKPEHCKRELYNIMVKCWEKSADNRPTFSDLVRDFEALLVREMDYIDLNMFEEDGYHNAAISLSGERV